MARMNCCKIASVFELVHTVIHVDQQTKIS
jgi:hypothetical protein